MSQAVGPFCNVKQDVTSWNYTEGASVALELIEYERESKSFFASILKILILILPSNLEKSQDIL